MHFRSGGVDPGRDGCRVPLPWAGHEPPYAFGPDHDPGIDTWLPQPDGWGHLTVEAQAADPASALSLTRMALLIRRTNPDLGDGAMQWLEFAPTTCSPSDAAQLRLRRQPRRHTAAACRDHHDVLARQHEPGGRSPAARRRCVARSTLSPSPHREPPTAQPSTHAPRPRRQPTTRHPPHGIDAEPHEHRAQPVRGRRQCASHRPACRLQLLGIDDDRQRHGRRQGRPSPSRAWRPGDEQAHHRRVQEAGRRVHEGQPEHHGRAQGVGVERGDLRHPARRRHPAHDVPRPVHRRPRRLIEREPDRRPHRAGQGAARTPSKFNPSVLRCGQERRRPHLRRCRATSTASACTTTARCSRRPGSTRTSRRPRGTRCAPTPSRSPTKTGQAGYVQMSKNNTGGWMLTTLTYALGGRDPDAQTVTARHLDDQQPRHQAGARVRSRRCAGRTTRWAATSCFDWGAHQPGVRGRPGRHVHDRLGRLQRARAREQDQAGLTTASRRCRWRRAATPASSAVARSPRSAPRPPRPSRTAAVKWIDFYYMRKLTDQDAAVADAEALTERRRSRSARRRCRSSTRPRWHSPTGVDQADYVNVPLDQMTSFTDDIFDQTLVPEPASHTPGDLRRCSTPSCRRCSRTRTRTSTSLLDAGQRRRARRSSQG